MVLETEIIYQQSIPVLDVKYHLCVAQEHGVKVEVSASNAVPVFSKVRVSSESISTETSLFESVCFFSCYFFIEFFWIVIYYKFVSCGLIIDFCSVKELLIGFSESVEFCVFVCFWIIYMRIWFSLFSNMKRILWVSRVSCFVCLIRGRKSFTLFCS